MQCETPDQLVEIAKSNGIDLTLDEAQAYLDEMDDFELDSKQLKAVAGGLCSDDCSCNDDCGGYNAYKS